MRKILLLIVLFGATITGLRAQVGIGTQNPNKAAQLEINSDSPTTNRGLLIPRIELTSTTMLLTNISENDMPNSILVFNKKNFTEGGKNYSVGYYYWATDDKSEKGKGKWVPLLAGESNVVNNFFNTVKTNSSTVNYNSVSNTLSVNVGNGLKETTAGGKTIVGLGGELSENTEIKLGTHTLKISGLKSTTTTTDEVVVVAPDGTLRTVKGVSAKQIITDGGASGQVLTVDASGEAVWKSVGGGGASSLINASNGLTFSGTTVVLGGALTKSTTIETNGANTLAIKGLQNGAGNDKLVVTDAAGILRTVTGVTTAQINANGNKGKFLTVDNNGVVTWTSFGGTSTSSIDFSGLAGNGLVFNTTSGTLDVQAENGLKIEGDKVKLGGPLTGNTTITTATDKTLAIQGLQDGTGNDKLVVTDADGVLKTVSGVTTSQIVGGDSNKGKILTVNDAGVVTWTSLSGTNSIDFSGVAGKGLEFNNSTKKIDVVPGNGIQIDGNNKVEWGGELTKTATIVTDADKAFVIEPKGGVRTTSNVIIKNLPTGTVSDSFVVVDGDGNLKTVDPKSAAKIDYTEGPQETGRIWRVPVSSTSPAIEKPVKEMTFRVNFGTGSTKVEVTDKLGTDGNVTVIGIRLIGIDNNPNYINSNATYRYNYNPDTNGADTRDWIFIGTNQDAFSVTIKGWYFVIVEYFEN